MSDAKGQAEPTMEEILASIRRIISEDDADERPASESESAVPEEPAEAAAPGSGEPDEDVLELTHKLEDDGSVVDLRASEAPAGLEPEHEPEPEPEFEPEPEPEIAMTEPESDDEGLLAPETKAATLSSLSEIVRAAAEERASRPSAVGDARSLEQIVLEALRPELKAWLDANLPELVERVVREEVRKLVRRTEEDL